MKNMLNFCAHSLDNIFLHGFKKHSAISIVTDPHDLTLAPFSVRQCVVIGGLCTLHIHQPYRECCIRLKTSQMPTGTSLSMCCPHICILFYNIWFLVCHIGIFLLCTTLIHYRKEMETNLLK